MCGITGYVGQAEAAPILLDGLSKLEYRGYDSAGIAVRDNDGKVRVVKAKGRLKILSEKTDGGTTLPGHIGIGHTRWATHGEPSEANAHPHISDESSDSSAVVGVHNGIIENYHELKEKLIEKGYKFYSDTDTEVAVKLVDSYYRESGSPLEALEKSMVVIRGSYALAFMFKDYPDEIWTARKDSPMIIGVTNDESFIASDVPAILKRTRTVYYVDNLEICRVRAGDVKFYNIEGESRPKEAVSISWDAQAAEKDGYEHFMIKEIHEQPKAVYDTLSTLLKDGLTDLSSTGLEDSLIRNFRGVTIAACGSAWHVGIEAQYLLEGLARIPVRVELASEYRYRDPLPGFWEMNSDSAPVAGPVAGTNANLGASGNPGSGTVAGAGARPVEGAIAGTVTGTGAGNLVIIISQSGETADSLAALREARKRGAHTLAIVNVLGSSIAREAEFVLYTHAGPEIAVATTKAYSAQLAAIDVLALHFARVRGVISEERERQMTAELMTIPDKIRTLLDEKDRIQWFASKKINTRDAFFIGRGLDYAVCLEGSLKMKEVSYVHSEAYASGELKHGTISLLEQGTLVVSVLTQNRVLEKTLSNMVECKSRGAYLMAVTTHGHFEVEDIADFTVYIPKIDEHFAGSLAIIPLQLLGYYTSVARGIDVDKPRNLAKSVTVE
ncbi:MAG: glutamine--fructose-6-phosphate aminotransferase [Candidatus Cryptobacteroides sp.]|nr:glutamine--fructose-6-phosphate aminotransferase [Candidatus Cryptobacteroides sp.]